VQQNSRFTRFWQSRAVRSTRQLASPRQWYRQFTSAHRPFPGCIIAGAQKAGTTSLFDYLSGHPQCAPSYTKEVHYFDDAFDRGENWYRMHFPLSAQPRLCYESSPYYMFDPRVPARVRELLPDVKLIFLLRDPVSRAYSHYQHSVRRGHEPLSFEAALDAEPQRLAGEQEQLIANPYLRSNSHRWYSYATRGYYADQLVRWFRLFPRRQILLLQAEWLFKQPTAAFSEVLDFLELDAWRPANFASSNRGRYQAPMSESTATRLRCQFTTANERLFELIGNRYDW
jgi:hypothetical protein